MLLSHHNHIFPFLHYTATPAQLFHISHTRTTGHSRHKKLFKGLEINSFTQAVYHIGKLWTKLKDAVFKTTFIWGSCRGLWYITSYRLELTHTLLGNPNPRLQKKSKPARISETNITGLLRTISLCGRAAGFPRKLLSHLNWESAPVWLSGAWLCDKKDKSGIKTFMNIWWVKHGYKERKTKKLFSS